MCEVEGEVPTKAVIDPPLSTPLPSKTLNTLLSSKYLQCPPKYPSPKKTQHSRIQPLNHPLPLKTPNFPKYTPNALDKSPQTPSIPCPTTPPMPDRDKVCDRFFFYLLQPPGGCKGMCLLDCNLSMFQSLQIPRSAPDRRSSSSQA